MAQSYFIFNGQDSRNMGVISRRAAPLIRPEERVEHTAIPGRSGDLTFTQGENIYNSYIQTVNISVVGAENVRRVFRWLRGAGMVTFSGQPDLRQPARVIGAVTLEKVSRNMDHWAGTVQFYCQPLKERLFPATETLTAPGSVQNAGDVDAHPLITLTPAANADTVALTVNGETLSIAGAAGDIIIDCDAMEITNADKTELMTIQSAGPFPILAPGANAVSGDGWTKIEIDKRERFL